MHDHSAREALEGLIEEVVAGDAAAWSRLVAQLMPRIRNFACSHPELRKRGLASQPDDVADVMTACIERLARRDRRNLARYLERLRDRNAPRPNFDSWLYGTVDYVVRDHLRARYGRAPTLNADDVAPHQSKRALEAGMHDVSELQLRQPADRLLGVTTQLTFLEIFAYVEAEFAPDEIRALRLHYVEDRNLSELAASLCLSDEAAADRLLRKLKGRLRKRFGIDA